MDNMDEKVNPDKKSRLYLLTWAWSGACVFFMLLSIFVYFRGISGLPYLLWGEKTISIEAITQKEGNLFIASLEENRLSAHLRPSPARLLEDGKSLDRPNANRNELKTKGKGRYVFLENSLYFSSSDNSSPLTNGRTYTIRFPLILWEEAVYGITILLIAGVILAAIFTTNNEPDTQNA